MECSPTHHRRHRAPVNRTVDVFIATYNEPLDIVLKTAIAARNMHYPHKTWILDDGDRPEFAAAARRIGVGYITRGPDWEGKPRFAKAGNVNNALFRTTGEFIAIFDADQVPEPEFLDRVLGHFDDPEVAFVQTPQQFWNVPKSRSARQPGRAVLRLHPAGEGRLGCRILLWIQRRAAPGGAHGAGTDPILPNRRRAGPQGTALRAGAACRPLSMPAPRKTWPRA